MTWLNLAIHLKVRPITRPCGAKNFSRPLYPLALISLRTLLFLEAHLLAANEHLAITPLPLPFATSVRPVSRPPCCLSTSPLTSRTPLAALVLLAIRLSITPFIHTTSLHAVCVKLLSLLSTNIPSSLCYISLSPDRTSSFPTQDS